MTLKQLIIPGLLCLGIAAFIVSNWSDRVDLVFLGRTTASFPLALWLLVAIATGIVGALLIYLLLQLAIQGALRQQRQQTARASSSFQPPRWSTTRPAEPQDDFEDDEPEEEWEPEPSAWATRQQRVSTVHSTYQAPPIASPPYMPPPIEDEEEDDTPAWEDPSWADEPEPESVEDLQEDSNYTANPIPLVEPATQAKVREIQREPQSESHSGSTYSYTFRTAQPTSPPSEQDEPSVESVPQDSKPEPPSDGVYDANFRVVQPGTAPTSKPKPETPKTDDWDFDTDSDDW